MYIRIPHFVHSMLAMRALSEFLHFETNNDHTVSCAGKRGMLK